MAEIYDKIMKEVRQWRADGYFCDEFPAIAEILDFNRDEHGALTFLREPQFEALETYWYLRLKLNTPKFLELYKHFYPEKRILAEAVGINSKNPEIIDFMLDDKLFETIIENDEFAKRHKMDTLKEALSLDYASYIMALTMGAGKTILIATIIATEFAMSLEYNDERFMKNALVFAPDKTILDSLREIASTPFEKILPLKYYNMFTANFKILWAEDKAKDINGLIAKSSYNIVVSNTQKIIPRKISKRNGQNEIDYEEKEKQHALTVNLRLQKIASLPSIGIFSDEAHHTYGNKIGDEIKRVREAINYIADETEIICVVNTTGTPYAGRQTLKEVVYWYSLQQGIKDNILKSLEDSIIDYTFKDREQGAIIEEVIRDFFSEYGAHKLPNGAKAKIAFYFKNSQHLEESKPFIEKALAKIKQPASLMLQNTEKSSQEELDEFRRLNDPGNQRRVILLINKGTEGWDCPSLFATALIRNVTASNNFVLQSSTRCLRQVEGNNKPARIYLEEGNMRTLNSELQNNFKIGLSDLLFRHLPQIEEKKVTIKKTGIPDIEIILNQQNYVFKENLKEKSIVLKSIGKLKSSEEDFIYKTVYEPNLSRDGEALTQTGDIKTIEIENNECDIFTATKDIASRYHLSYNKIYEELIRLYPSDNIPVRHLGYLFFQIDEQMQNYDVVETEIVQALAIIKFYDEQGNEVFEKDNNGFYYHTIRYNKDLQQHFLSSNDAGANKSDFGFHYDPYNFDSKEEKDFFEKILTSLNTKPKDIKDIYFTGGLTTPRKTGFYFEYEDVEGKFRKYYPDFVIVKNNGDFLIVEIKPAKEERKPEPDTLAKKAAVKKIEDIAGNRFKYHILCCDYPISKDKMADVQQMLF